MKTLKGKLSGAAAAILPQAWAGWVVCRSETRVPTRKHAMKPVSFGQILIRFGWSVEKEPLFMVFYFHAFLVCFGFFGWGLLDGGSAVGFENAVYICLLAAKWESQEEKWKGTSKERK